MVVPFIVFEGYEALVLLMGASLVSYQASKISNSYPSGYEMSSEQVRLTQHSSPQLNIKYPHLQDPAVFALLLSALTSGSSDVSNTAATEVIDQTDSDDIEPDTKEAVRALEKEIESENYQLDYQINYYQAELNRLQTGQKQITHYSQEDLQYFIDSSKKKKELLKNELYIVTLHSQRGLTDEEEESVRQTAAEKMVRVKEKQEEKAKECDCSIIPFITKKTFRRNMSDLSADYQGALSGESWQRTRNPKSGKISVEINEWLYVSADGKVRADFDGWLERFCLLLEMKANYDSLMFSRTEFVDVEKTIPELKSLGKKKVKSFSNQASRHSKICLQHPYAHCCWIFMTPFAYNAFLDILEVNSFPALSAVWVPLP